VHQQQNPSADMDTDRVTSKSNDTAKGLLITYRQFETEFQDIQFDMLNTGLIIWLDAGISLINYRYRNVQSRQTSKKRPLLLSCQTDIVFNKVTPQIMVFDS
jgi:hypothetical protein